MVKKNKFRLSGMLLMIGMLLSTTVNAALTMRVDRNPVALNESFTLTLSSNESLDGDPDFSWIDREFEVVNRNQSSNFQVINGDVSRSITWTMTLLAKNSGSFAVPPIRAGDQQSNAMTLLVKERAVNSPEQSGAANSEGLFLRIETDSGELYVQQQMLYTIKLFLAHDAGMSIGNGSSLSEPELESGDAVIKRLGEDSNYQTVLNGKRYSVIERRYALYPQQSGTLTIKPILFDGRMVESMNRRQSIFDAIQQRDRIKRITSDKVVREVKAVPAAYQGHQWLPAKSVQLVEEWPEQQGMMAGEPITRTLALLVDGITSAQLPTFNMTTPSGLKSYPDQPLLREIPSDQGITSLRQEKIALVASAPGKFTLPAIEVTWWNTETGQQEIARLAERRINVTAAEGTRAQPPQLTVPEQNSSEPVTPDGEGTSHNSVEHDDRWLMLVVAMASGWLLTLLLWWRSSRRVKEIPTVKPLTTENLRTAQRKVKQACRDNDAGATKDALIQWGQGRWPESHPASLGELARRVGGELAGAVDNLSHSLYSAAKANWRGDVLWQAFNQQQSDNNKVKSQRGGLAPLFRHQ